MGISVNEIMFYGGIATAAVAVILGITAAVLLHISKKKLKAKLETEYGEKLH